MNEIKRLRKAIRDLHGVDSAHLRSEAVHEKFQGRTVWEGIVEVFALKGHPKATQAYAWAHETDDGRKRYVAVLGVPPITDACAAVRAAIASEKPRG